MTNLFPHVLTVDASGAIVGPEKPIRVQRSRKAGWRMPENTVYVGRPSKWGNPFGTAEEFRVLLEAILGISGQSQFHKVDLRQFAHIGYIANDIEQLRGKNLACWCGLDHTCHADVLLELANSIRSGHLLDGVEVRETMEGE